MSIAGGYYKAVLAAAEHGMDTVQIFTKNNNQWRSKPISDEEAELFAKTLADKSIQRPIAHASYLINLASPDDALRQKSIESLVVELTRAAQLGIAYVVVHPGAHTTVTLEEGIALVAKSLDEAHRQLPAGAANVALEITAGQGTCLGCSLAQLAAIIDQVEQKGRVGLCLDTCHLFAAGYDIRDRKAYLALWREFDELLGRERLKAIHLNDSKRELGSRIDRHEHIGRGHIGLAGFAHFLHDRRLKDVPMYLETPKGDHNGQSWDAINMRTLRDVAAGRK